MLTLASCASRKVNIEKTDIKKDSITNTSVKVVTVENKEKTDSTKINTNIDCSETTIIPIDSSKTIIVDGKSYKNVILRIKKSKVNSLYTNNKKESNIKRIDSVVTTKLETKNRTLIKNKSIDKKANYWFLFYWLILILILYLLWRNRMQLLKLL